MISSVNSMNIHQNMLNISAANIASFGKKEGGNLAKEVVDQMVAADGFAVNASSIKTEDEMTRTLLDIKA